MIAAIASAVLLGAVTSGAHAQRVPAQPIPEGTAAGQGPAFIGSTATPEPVDADLPPRHPFMAPNGKSNIHDDAYMTDSYEQSGPLGREIETLSTFLGRECGSVTFDSQGRIVSVCVGLDGPLLALLDSQTLDLLASFPLPPRDPTSGNPFTSFGGGGYFYLDDQDRSVLPTNNRHIFLVRETDAPGFELERDYDVSSAVPLGDQITSALPDFSGLIWFASAKGVVGTLDPDSGAVKSIDLAPESITNSFSVDETGGVYIVSDRKLYRFDAADDGTPEITWSETYQNSGLQKPGQVDDGSGTTPTVMGDDHVTITDNADPMNVVVYRRAANVTGSRLACEQPVFVKGQSATDNSLIVANRSIVVENNFGYTGPGATTMGGVTSPGIERVDLDADGTGCSTVWKSQERAPSVVPKLSLANGLIYTYTKDPQPDDNDAWYLTTLSFRTGATVYRALAGGGLGYNNNYAPVSIGPDGTAYVGVLGGLTLFRDTAPAGGGGNGGGGGGGTDQPGGGGRGSGGEADGGGAAVDEPLTAEASADPAAGEAAEELPFTGLALAPLLAAGVLLLASGMSLRLLTPR